MGRSIWSMEPLSRPGSTRERLMDAAAMLFYEHGFHAIGLDRILAEVGVTKTTFYNHFESKDALIVAVLQHRDQRDMDQLRDELARRGHGPREQVLDVFDVLDEWFRDGRFKGCLFINAAAQFPNPHDPVHVAAARHGQNLHRAFLDMVRAAGAAEPETLARQLAMLAAAAITTRHVSGDPGAARTAHAMAEALLDRAGGGATRPADRAG
jgi:AcrR family transcriptional regulator